jgi:hypothetical protein
LGRHCTRRQSVFRRAPPSPPPCAYGVQPDWTGTLTVVIPGLGTFTIAFVIVDHGQEVHMISLDPGGEYDRPAEKAVGGGMNVVYR